MAMSGSFERKMKDFSGRKATEPITEMEENRGGGRVVGSCWISKREGKRHYRSR